MPTVFSHAVAGLALGVPFREQPPARRLLALGALSAVLPDVDVLAFRAGIPYEHPLGHRGFSHSLAFAALWATICTWSAFRGVATGGARGRIWLYLFLATASHGLLDALTTGGRGVGFFVPFWNERYFFPWRPIRVSPLGLRRFMSERGAQVIASELRWVWLPSALFALAAWTRRRRPTGIGS